MTTKFLDAGAIEIIPYGLSLGKIVMLALLCDDITTPFRGFSNIHVNVSVNSGIVSFTVWMFIVACVTF